MTFGLAIACHDGQHHYNHDNHFPFGVRPD